jgi:hypothetical protein
MHIPPLLAFSAWIPIGLFLFRRFELRVAILANFLAGWAVLQREDYATAKGYVPYLIIPVSLPSVHFVSNATTLGFTARYESGRHFVDKQPSTMNLARLDLAT